MGLLGLPFAEEDGGVGAGPVEIGIVCQELGRVIAPEPYLTSVVLAGGLVSACGTAEQRQELLGALSGGESCWPSRTTSPGEAGPRRPSRSPRRRTATPGRSPASRNRCSHGARADVLVVSAALPDGGTGLFVVDGADGRAHRLPGVRRQPRRPRLLRRHRRHAPGRGRRAT